MCRFIYDLKLIQVLIFYFFKYTFDFLPVFLSEQPLYTQWYVSHLIEYISWYYLVLFSSIISCFHSHLLFLRLDTFNWFQAHKLFFMLVHDWNWNSLMSFSLQLYFFSLDIWTLLYSLDIILFFLFFSFFSSASTGAVSLLDMNIKVYFFISCVYVCDWVSAHYFAYRRQQRPKELINSFGNGVTGSCESSALHTRNWTWALCKRICCV